MKYYSNVLYFIGCDSMTSGTAAGSAALGGSSATDGGHSGGGTEGTSGGGGGGQHSGGGGMTPTSQGTDHYSSYFNTADSQAAYGHAAAAYGHAMSRYMSSTAATADAAAAAGYASLNPYSLYGAATANSASTSQDPDQVRTSTTKST